MHKKITAFIEEFVIVLNFEWNENSLQLFQQNSAEIFLKKNLELKKKIFQNILYRNLEILTCESWSPRKQLLV